MISVSGTSLPPIPTYLQVSGDEQKYIDQYAKATPAAQNAVTYLQANAATLTSPAALLKNYRALQVVLGAFNISSLANSPAMLKQLMTQDPSSTSSLSYKLGNVNYTRFAVAMTQQPFALTTSSGVSAIVNQYLANGFEAQEGKAVPGLQQALYFTNNISSITNVNQLLSDTTLLNVVVKATGLPSTFGTLDYTTQVGILNRTVDFTKFQDADWVKKTAETYLIKTQSDNLTNTSDPSGLLTLLGVNTGSGSGGATDILSALYPNVGTDGAAGLLAAAYPTDGTGSLLSTLA